MKSVLLTLLGLLIGIGLMASGIYYLRKEKGDKDSIKIYGAFIGIGAVTTVALITKIFVAGL